MSETQDDTTTRTAIGQYGQLVVARCTGCKSTRKKRADVDPDGKQSFKHVCHVCKKSTYWNVIDYVDDQDDRDGVDRGDGPITDGGERTTLDDLDDDREIYHAGRNTGKNVKMHLDESCGFLEAANYIYATRAGKLHGDRVVCSLCDGEFSRGGDTGDPTEFNSMVADLDPEDVGLEPIGDRAGSGSV